MPFSSLHVHYMNTAAPKEFSHLGLMTKGGFLGTYGQAMPLCRDQKALHQDLLNAG
jgi:hypothetical protein